MRTNSHARIQTTEGQFRPLSRRLSPLIMLKRDMRINARSTVAGELRWKMAVIAGVLTRGFFGRLKWLLFGR